jgi:hypothetical protein
VHTLLERYVASAGLDTLGKRPSGEDPKGRALRATRLEGSVIVDDCVITVRTVCTNRTAWVCER